MVRIAGNFALVPYSRHLAALAGIPDEAVIVPRPRSFPKVFAPRWASYS